MKKLNNPVLFVPLAFATVFCSTPENDNKPNYEENWESLSKVNQTPEWFLDAKFGIYTHWGPVSEALLESKEGRWYSGWYGKAMYEDGKKVPTRNGKPTNNFLHHNEKYGDPAEFGYDHVIRQFSPTAFDASVWAELFAASGAKFAGPVAMHHDNFAMWNAKSTRWNSMNYGGIDPSATLKREIESRGMKFMASFHHAFTWKYFAPAHTYSKIKPEDYDLYTSPHSLDSDSVDARFRTEWWAKLKEYIDVYEPDLIWFDWWLENLPEEDRIKFLAYYYNAALEWGKEVAVAYKESTFPISTAIKDYERGRPNQPKSPAWLTDTSPGAWFYRTDAKFKEPNGLIDILIDIVAKNGVMLLNVPPDPSGAIPEEMKELLLEMGKWLKVNADAIYGTRPWTIFGEGPTRLPEGGHKVEEKKAISYTNLDIRYTRKSDKEFYAIVMDHPDQEIVMKSLSTDIGVLNSRILSVTLLGSTERLKWERDTRGLVVSLPHALPQAHAYCFKILLEGYTENDIGGNVAAHEDGE
ncbi:MAG: alpha-L-fucosidase [Bacteroidota bacterium]